MPKTSVDYLCVEVLIFQATDWVSRLTLMDFDRFSIVWECELIYKDRSPAKMKCHSTSALWFFKLTLNVRIQRLKNCVHTKIIQDFLLINVVMLEIHLSTHIEII